MYVFLKFWPPVLRSLRSDPVFDSAPPPLLYHIGKGAKTLLFRLRPPHILCPLPYRMLPLGPEGDFVQVLFDHKPQTHVRLNGIILFVLHDPIHGLALTARTALWELPSLHDWNTLGTCQRADRAQCTGSSHDLCASESGPELLCTTDSSQDIVGFCWMVLCQRQLAGRGWNDSGVPKPKCSSGVIMYISVANYNEVIDALKTSHHFQCLSYWCSTDRRSFLLRSTGLVKMTEWKNSAISIQK